MPFQIEFDLRWGVDEETQALYSLLKGELLPLKGEIIYTVEAGTSEYPRAVKAALGLLAAGWKYTFPESRKLRITAGVALSETKYRFIIGIAPLEDVVYFLIEQMVSEKSALKAESFIAGGLWAE